MQSAFSAAGTCPRLGLWVSAPSSVLSSLRTQGEPRAPGCVGPSVCVGGMHLFVMCEVCAHMYACVWCMAHVCACVFSV